MVQVCAILSGFFYLLFSSLLTHIGEEIALLFLLLYLDIPRPALAYTLSLAYDVTSWFTIGEVGGDGREAVLGAMAYLKGWG